MKIKSNVKAGYVDGYIIPIPKRNVSIYKKMAKEAGKLWRKHGALDYKECAGDDLNTTCGITMDKLSKAGKNETVIFAFITFKSRRHRDSVNKKVEKEMMSDPRMQEMQNKPMPMDMRKMAYGGFKIIVDE
jgi:uncharacterized protein YbaA (DUF1428 family)